jgi:hypothetical protein
MPPLSRRDSGTDATLYRNHICSQRNWQSTQGQLLIRVAGRETRHGRPRSPPSPSICTGTRGTGPLCKSSILNFSGTQAGAWPAIPVFSLTFTVCRRGRRGGADMLHVVKLKPTYILFRYMDWLEGQYRMQGMANFTAHFGDWVRNGLQ